VSWSYSGDPSASDLDMVRWLMGDTDENHQEVSNEEIDAALGMAASTTGAAVLVLDALIARYSFQVDYSWGGEFQESASQRVEQLRKRRAELAAGGLDGLRPYTADFEAEDDEIHASRFDIGMHDYNSSAGSNSG